MEEARATEVVNLNQNLHHHPNLNVTAVFVLLGIYISIIFYTKIIPGVTVAGYAVDHTTLKPLQYKLNGFTLFLLSLCAFLSCLSLGFYPTYLYDNYWAAFTWANVVGISASVFFYVRNVPKSAGLEPYNRSVTADQVTSTEAMLVTAQEIFGQHVKMGTAHSTATAKVNETGWKRFYLGSQWNPRLWQDIDVKMTLYAIGAILLEYNILSCVAHQMYTRADHKPSLSMITYSALFTWFVAEYMYFENVHLYTYDLFAEKIGFKLTWGCLVFYPFCYCMGCYSIAAATETGTDISYAQAFFIVALFFSGWVMTRGANLQKYQFRTNPSLKTFSFLGGLLNMEQRSIPGTRLLCSGFWKQARHLNYFGEIVQSIALAVSCVLVAPTLTYRVLPMLYPIYYILLFVPRAQDDHVLCARKYGHHWDAYCEEVQWKICPFVW